MPTHFGLHGDVARASLECRIVKGATRSGVEVRSVEKDAGIINKSSRDGAVLVSLRDATCTFGLELPLFVAECGSPTLNLSDVVIINEVCAVGAAALHQLFCRTSEDALTPIAKDAGPVARQERDVKDPGSFFSSIGKAHPFVKVSREFRSHGGRGYPEAPQVEDALLLESALTLAP